MGLLQIDMEMLLFEAIMVRLFFFFFFFFVHLVELMFKYVLLVLYISAAEAI